MVTAELVAGAVLRVGFGGAGFGDLTVEQVSGPGVVRTEPSCALKGGPALDFFTMNWTAPPGSGELPDVALSVRDVAPLVSYDDTTCTDLVKFPLGSVEPGVQRVISAVTPRRSGPRVLVVSLDDGLDMQLPLVPVCTDTEEPTPKGSCVINPITFDEGTTFSKAVPAP